MAVFEKKNQHVLLIMELIQFIFVDVYGGISFLTH